MKVLVGSLGAVDLSVGIVFLACALAFISRLGEVANSYLILTKFSVYAAIPLVAFVLFAIAYALIGKAEKKGVEDKAGKGLFVASLAINGGAIIVCGVFAHVFHEKKISFMFPYETGIPAPYLEFAVVSYILGILVVLAAVGLVLYTVFGKKKKPIPTLR